MDLYAVVCRPALPKDTDDVMALTSRIWEGHDYVPHYWQTWLEDPYGLLAVAEYAGHVVGLGKISWIGGHEWWFQGLRVHPDHQGKGIASRLHRYQLDYWERNCRGVLRLATSSARLPVHHLCQRTGFRRVGEFRSFVASVLAPDPDSFSQLTLGEVGAALDFVRQSELFELSSGLSNLDWVWSEPAADHLIAAIQGGNAYWWAVGGDNCGLLVAGIDKEEKDVATAYIQLVAGKLNKLPEMMLDFRQMAAKRGFSQINWLAPDHDGVIAALAQAGFTLDWEHSLYIYEKRLPI